MEQRRLRLGDILDDYCPRERRVTNHAVVAMIEEDVKQTRCTTCDAEHAYKGGRAPRRRKKETAGTLYEEVLAGLPEPAEETVERVSAPIPAGATAVADGPPPELPAPAVWARAEGDQEAVPPVEPAPILRFEASSSDTIEPASDTGNVRVDSVDSEESDPGVDGPVHRRLIRATLPRIEGQKDARPMPEFTVRQAPTRGQGHGGGRPNPNYRGERVRMGGGNGNGNGQGEPNGNRAHSGSGPRFQGSRPAGGRPSSGRPGGPSGFRNGSGAGPRGKRGRGSRG